MKPLVLVACFSPLAIIWIVMKLSWFQQSMTSNMSEQNQNHTDLCGRCICSVDEEEEEYGDRTDYG